MKTLEDERYIVMKFTRFFPYIDRVYRVCDKLQYSQGVWSINCLRHTMKAVFGHNPLATTIHISIQPVLWVHSNMRHGNKSGSVC